MTSKKHLEPGATLGRYELLTPIAQGGMATVWAARQTGLHGFRRTVAVKTMLASLSDDPQFEVMFLSEARNAMRVHHPNVVEVLDLGEDGALLYQVMEWIDGESLSVLMKTLKAAHHPFPMRIALSICAKVARGLHAAHEATDEEDRPLGLVHRDVSPQNVMVTYEGQVKVVDFGVAKSHAEASATVAGQLKGKVPYMAPEQAIGNPIDRRADVFALGTLVYRLIADKHPFASGNELTTYNNVIHRDPPPLRELLGDGCPVELEQLVRSCLAKDPSRRPSTIAEAADALERVLAQLGPVSEQELATFAKLHLGDHRKQRRSAMRQAAQSLGWAFQSSESLPRASISGSGLTPRPPMAGSLTPPSQATAPSFVVSHDVPRPASRARPILLVAAVLVAGAAGVGLVRFMVGVPGAKDMAGTAASGAPSASIAASATAAPSASPPPRPVELPPPAAAPSVAETPKALPPPDRVPQRPTRPPPPRPGQPRPAASSWGAGPDVGF